MTEAGFRVVPHTADVILEAWGPTRVDCLEQAVLALVSTFAELPDGPPSRTVPLELDAALDEDLLVALLEDVCYLVDADGLVPVAVDLEEDEEGTVRGTFEVVPADAVEPAGAVPKGISRSNLVCGRTNDGWHCRAVVDV